MEKEKGMLHSLPWCNPTTLAALTELGKGTEASVEEVNGREKLLCSFLHPKQLQITLANTIRWHIFKQLTPDQRMDKLPTTQSVWFEHIRRAQVPEWYSEIDT